MKLYHFFFPVLLLISFHTASQTFIKITGGIFVNDGGASRSVSIIDYDGDGDLDIYVSNGKRFGQYNFLYQNSPGGFNKITGLSVTQDSLPYDGASWADFDNDGDLDLCVVTWYDSTNMLYRNDGSTFALLENSPVVINRGFSEACSWCDFDNDGLVDLFITNSLGSGHRNWLYKNNGSGNFTRIDSGAIFLDAGFESRGVNWVDIDGDRDLDLFVTNESAQNEILYKNEGGWFSKVLSIPPVINGGNSWSSSWGDIDNDGDFDLFVANWNGSNKLYLNNGNFDFTEVNNDSIVSSVGYHASCGWGDYDNDGDLDMFITQAYKTPNSPLKNLLYKNKFMETGIAGFEKIIDSGINNDSGYSYGFAWGDLDADGDLDIFTANTYGESQNNSCYINNGNTNKWLEVKCTGTSSNRSAIGAKVRIKAVINNNPVWQVREVDAQSGYCGQNLDLHFGLGSASIIDSITVEWPSGTTQYFTAIQLNQIIRIDETQGIIGILKHGSEVPGKFILYQNYPNPFNPYTIITFQIPDYRFTSLKIYNILGKEAAVLVNQQLRAGVYKVRWDASNYPSGIYLFELSADNFKTTKRMVLVK